MLGLVTLCLLLWICVLRYRRVRLVESHAHPLPPAYPGYLPIIGHTHLLLVDTIKIMDLVNSMSMVSLQHDGLIYLKFGPDIYYVISDPEDALLVANTCLEKHFLYRFAKCMLGEGLITGSRNHWHRHRELLKSNFSVPIINGYLEVFNSQSKALLNDVECYVEKGQFDPSSHLKQISLGTSYLTTFGNVGNKKCFPKYMKAVDEMLCLIMRRFQKFWLQNEFIYKLSGEKNLESELVKTANEVSDEVLQTKRSFLKGPNGCSSSTYVSYQSLIDLMLEQHYKNNFTDQEISEELHTSIVASFETTTHSLETILVMIGSHPRVQEKIYEEIMQVLGTNGDVHKDDLRKLVYTDAVIKESLRLIPTVPLIVRFIDRDVKLKNYTLRAGSQCIISNLGLLHHASWGPDAEAFRPERWLDTASIPTSIATDAAFSFGKRSCLGKTYAMTLMKVVIVQMVRKYIITADHTKLRFKFEITSKAVTGHEISLQHRNI